MPVLHLQGVLDAGTLSAVREAVAELPFGSGAHTAAGAARRVKDNEQALPGAAADAVGQHIRDRLQAHPVFAAVRPRTIAALRLSRYRGGMHYGLHVDAAVIDGVRTDLSFTCFLTDPDEYDGGALCIHEDGGEQRIKLPAGDACLYPSASLHEVEAVTRGERVAAVGWVESRLRSAEQRSVIMALDGVLDALNDASPPAALRPALLRVHGALLRMWLDS
ncbi:MAG: Fe2+-dependent dioxygenase [Pseudomonadales bacterium]